MAEPFDASRITRPHPSLAAYYAVSSLVLGPLFPLLLVPRLIRFNTLRYRFAEDGISMSWGVLFRHEIHLTYDRIQDIHLRSSVVERWFGLARVPVQTASGSAKAELTIEGVREYEALRDFIYERMRGARREPGSGTPAGETAGAVAGTPPIGELVETLQAVATELRAIRLAVERRPPAGDGR